MISLKRDDSPRIGSLLEQIPGSLHLTAHLPVIKVKSRMSNDFRYGFLADGKLILVSRDGGESEHTSEFVTGLQQRLQSIKDRSEWKLKGSGAQFMRGGLPVSEGAFEVDHFQAEFSSACFHPADGRLIYGVDAGEVRGLFAHDAKDNLEQRLLHGPARRFGAIDIRHQGEEEEWLLAVMGNDGTSRIGYFTPKKGGGVREVTEGDSIDSYPAWIPGGDPSICLPDEWCGQRPEW